MKNRHINLLLVALLLSPLAAICGAAESSRPVAPSNPNVPARADLPEGKKPQGEHYNVLFIAVDDLNDWVGCLGGNPQAITPNLDRLAKQQAMVMNKAYAPSTVCCPSRSSLLTGKRPSSTGVYSNNQNLKNAPKAKDAIWVQPRLVAQVVFREWTDEGLVRQASFQGLRADKRPDECVREKPVGLPDTRPAWRTRWTGEDWPSA